MPNINIKMHEPAQGALFIEFDNQTAMNAFTPNMWKELINTLRSARRDDAIKVVILSGAGERAFSSGLSMDELDKMKCDEDYAVFYNLGLELRETIYTLGKPIIAAVKGLCVGGGFEIALCCDLIYCTENSKFMLPEINIGLVPGCGGAINLARKIPINRAFEIILFSERITAQNAKSLGLVNEIFAKENFNSELLNIITKIISKPKLAVAGLKELLAHTATTADDREALKAERKLSIDLMGTDDFINAVKAFKK